MIGTVVLSNSPILFHKSSNEKNTRRPEALYYEPIIQEKQLINPNELQNFTEYLEAKNQSFRLKIKKIQPSYPITAEPDQNTGKIQKNGMLERLHGKIQEELNYLMSFLINGSWSPALKNIRRNELRLML